MEGALNSKDSSSSSDDVELTVPLSSVEGKMTEAATGTVTLALRVGGAAAAEIIAARAARAAKAKAEKDAAWAEALRRAAAAMAAEEEEAAREEVAQAARRWDDFDDDDDDDSEYFIPGRISAARWIDLSRGRPPDLGYSSCR